MAMTVSACVVGDITNLCPSINGGFDKPWNNNNNNIDFDRLKVSLLLFFLIFKFLCVHNIHVL